mmetsp:Transcript_19262/g.44280  ORF Transcript_19262/g.44280 Transcript_19262/m.44280 type:complete len:288 (-) Transcript_19262:55-918(-)
MESTPFMRKMSVPLFCSKSPTHAWIRSRSRLPGVLIPRLVTLESCSWLPSVLRNSGSISSVRARSNPLMSRTLSTDTCELVQRWTGANLLMSRNRFVMRSSSFSSVTRSHLFSSSRSANATCSTASFSAPSGFSSSRCCSMCFASTMVTIPSSLANALTSSSTKKVCATGAGSAMPVVSITIASSLSFPERTRFANFCKTVMRSCRTVQQMQPFIISKICSSDCILAFLASSASSMPTSPNSFSITAIFFPCAAVRMWLSSVVFPLPRNPVSTVTGTRSISLMVRCG